MSGGHFDYQHHRLSDISSELERIVKYKNANEDDCDYEKYEYPQEVLNVFQEAKEYTDILYTMLHKIDYCICGDTCEEDLVREWEELRNKLHNVVQWYKHM